MELGAQEFDRCTKANPAELRTSACKALDRRVDILLIAQEP